MSSPAHRAPSRESTPPELARAAFRELHGPRLHGFALLLLLGDRPAAAALAVEALAAGSARLAELRHPERAAAWLRRRVTDGARRLRAAQAPPGDGRRVALAELGVDSAAYVGLAALDVRERAVIVAASVERLDRRDVATVAARDGARLDRLLRRATDRYARAVGDSPAGATVHDGPIVARIRATAARALT